MKAHRPASSSMLCHAPAVHEHSRTVGKLQVIHMNKLWENSSNYKTPTAGGGVMEIWLWQCQPVELKLVTSSKTTRKPRLHAVPTFRNTLQANNDTGEIFNY